MSKRENGLLLICGIMTVYALAYFFGLYWATKSMAIAVVAVAVSSLAFGFLGFVKACFRNEIDTCFLAGGAVAVAFAGAVVVIAFDMMNPPVRVGIFDAYCITAFVIIAFAAFAFSVTVVVSFINDLCEYEDVPKKFSIQVVIWHVMAIWAVLLATYFFTRGGLGNG